MATDTERLAMLDREAAHTAMCMFEAWLDFDEAGRAAWYPNLCRFREQCGIGELRLFIVDLAVALEEHARGRIEVLEEFCWDWDVVPLFLKFFDETHRGDAFAGAWEFAEGDVTAAFRRTVEHLLGTDSHRLPT